MSSEAASSTLHRIVRAESPTPEDFTSTMMRGRWPQYRDRQHPNEWVGLSVFDSADLARAMARCFPVLGAWVATVRCDPRRVIIAKTFGAGHYTVWGHPSADLDAIIAVEAV